MTKQNQNGRGRKFQDRQPGEKRPRTVKSEDTRKIKPPRPGANASFQPSEFGENRNNPDNRRKTFSGPKKEGFRENGPARFSKPGGYKGKSFGKPGEGFEKRDSGGFDKKKRSYSNDEKPPRFNKTEGREPREGRSGGGYSREGNNTRFGQNKFSDSSRRQDDRPRKSEERPRRTEERKDFGTEKRTSTRPYKTGERREFGSGDRPTGRTRKADEGEKFGAEKRPAKTYEKPVGRRSPVRGRTPEDRKFIKSTIKNADKNFKGSRRQRDHVSGDLEKANLLTGEVVRLNRYIANSGLCSRREADVMIEQGLVLVNGNAITELGYKVNPGDEVKVDGRRITPEKPVYIVLNKPKGYITSTMDPEGRATVMDLLDLNGKERIYPIGRLDRNTTGVLLLTNDGEFAQKLMHPSFEIKKVYKVKLDRKPNKEHMLAWVNGVELEDGFMSFQQCGFIEKEDDTILGVEIHSGRNRIVRRMFEHFQYEVVSLDRVLLGEFDHIKLGRGKWRFLNDKEIRYVERLKRMKAGKRKN